MIDICSPFEDFEYIAVGNNRFWFILLDVIIFVIITWFIVSTRSNKTPIWVFFSFLLFSTFPLIILRLIKSFYTIISPYQASLSHFLCIITRVETTLQYTFQLAHLCFLSIIVAFFCKFVSTIFDVRLLTQLFIFSYAFSLISSILLVNFNFITSFFAVLHAILYLFLWFFHFALQFLTMLRFLIREKRENQKYSAENFRYFWFCLLNAIPTTGHLYHNSITLSFLIAELVPSFNNITHTTVVQYINGVLSVRFMVSITIGLGPMILIPPLLGKVWLMIPKSYYRVASPPTQPTILIK